jgi:predicted site-specific integrase-resolvase
MAKAKNITTARKVDVVFVRKSSQGQDERGQIANVRAMLKQKGITVLDQHFFVCTVPRSRVSANAEFKRLMEMVEAGKVGTVYIESQDRFGTKSNAELFTLLNFFAECGTRLYDLRDGVDLAENDDATEIRAFLGGLKSKKERKDISYRSLRTRVQNFSTSGSWPTGTHPFGYGKACYSADGRLLWEWHPVSRSIGQHYTPTATGKLVPGPEGIKIPRKTNRDIIKLVPNKKKAFVESVKLVFDLYTRVGISRRKIAAKLNQEGRRFYDRQFTHTFVTQILTNPAYVGDTHFGKTQTGELHTFDDNGVLVPIKGKGSRKREVSERIVKQNTHEGLVSRDTWKKAQAKLKSERQRTSFAPRNPAYYLKSIFVCGHCGKGMTGRTETEPRTGKRKVVYVCSTYITSRINGHERTCGYFRISHDDAEKMLLDKIKELDLQYDNAPSEQARSNIANQLNRLDKFEEEALDQWMKQFEEGVTALLGYLAREYGLKPRTLAKLRTLAEQFYHRHTLRPGWFEGVPVKLRQFRQAIVAVEREGVEVAERKVSELTAEMRAYTKSRATASPMEEGLLREEIDRVEAEIKEWQSRTVPLSQRLKSQSREEDERAAGRRKLRRELPALENLEKGEAFRALFDKVTLYWTSKFIEAGDGPRKTNRPGRYSHSLDRDKMEWALGLSTVGGTW